MTTEKNALSYRAFVSANAATLGFGALHCFFSAPGQTFLISGFVASFGQTFGLTSADLGTIFLLATVGSGCCLVLVGHQIDTLRLSTYSLLAGLALAAACLVTATAPNMFVLVVGLFALRLTGQGLMIHIEATAIARSFGVNRGKALSSTSMGMPLAEAVLPPFAAALIPLVGWRWTYGLFGLLVLFVLVPLGQLLVPRTYPRPLETSRKSRPMTWDGAGRLLQSGFFWAALPTLVLVPFVGTAVIFHLHEIAARQGWSVELVAWLFPALAVGNAAGLLVSGPIVDLVSARRMLLVQAGPFLAALGAFALLPHLATLALVIGCLGLTNGAAKTAVSAVWAELFGTDRLGQIRSITTTLMVLATALGPLAVGLLLDIGWNGPRLLGTLCLAGVLVHLPFFVFEAVCRR